MTLPARGLALAFVITAAGAAPASAGSWELRVCADPDNLPYSNRAGEGFDNRIAAILADALDADLSTVWLPDGRGRTRQRLLQGGACDVVVGVLEGQPGLLTSYPVYRTGYVFVQRATAPVAVASLDDPTLHTLRIGLPGGGEKLVPPAVALARRGVVDNQAHFAAAPIPGARLPVLQALVDGVIDVAIVWGPAGGAFAREVDGYTVTPVSPEIDIPFTPMVASLALGVRPGDEVLRDAVDVALAGAWDEIHAVLVEAGVPLVDLPQPTATVEGGG